MKKVLSIIACAMLCAVMFVSCGSSSAFQKELETIENAFKNKDYTTALTYAKIILNAQDKATADDLIGGAAFAYASMVGMSQTGQKMDIADVLVIAKQIVTGLEKSKDKDLSYYNKCNEESKSVFGFTLNDMLSALKDDWIPKYENMLAGNTTVNDGSEEGNAEAEDEGDDEEYSDEDEEEE